MDEYLEPSPAQRLGVCRRLRSAPAPSHLVSPNAFDLVEYGGYGGAGGVGGARVAAAAAAGSLAHRRAAASTLPSHVYIVVHSIDGPAMRSDEAQALLASIASIPQVHVIASCSHRYAASLWDSRKARAFNWAWVEAPTGLSYAHEAVDSIHELLGSLFDSAVGTEGRSAQIVLDALTSNARKVFTLLLTFQLEHPKAPGLSFEELYKRSRAVYATSNEV
jgi:origin recognition complex subunit 2